MALTQLDWIWEDTLHACKLEVSNHTPGGPGGAGLSILYMRQGTLFMWDMGPRVTTVVVCLTLLLAGCGFVHSPRGRTAEPYRLWQLWQH